MGVLKGHGHARERVFPVSPDIGHLHMETRKLKEKEKKRLVVAIIITAAIMGVEIAGGIITNSLALLSDAGHMFTHVFVLGISYFAIRVSSRPADINKTFGYFRVEVLVAFINGLLLLGITGLILYRSAARLMNPQQVRGMEMLVVAIAGLIANGASFLLLMKSGRHNINLRSAFMHVVYDTASSIAVVAAAVIIQHTGFLRLDPLVSAGIGALILLWCFKLIRDSVNIILEAVPEDIHIHQMKRDIENIPSVKHVHDIHIWQITTDMYVMTAHAVVENMMLSDTQGIIEKINHILRERYGIGHSTLQLETAAEQEKSEMSPRTQV